ncbi:urease accessory protein UreD [Paraburkholderia fungorum]|jgi:urease accessory protein|uniref:Urease accessory protein UreD n=1 Tax=Paraburkholderia fungorum TaxID=134537 RepID=A0AAP5QJX2_9BURK|nr:MULTISPECIES: urease accessory protein UreD [Paraburkholderia]MDR8399462.1 urease accessory protein UreD [Paraburkholderia sp. USG1]MDT8843577.1 urease accessory protein UreD [Paraburkholderia fungorum]
MTGGLLSMRFVRDSEGRTRLAQRRQCYPLTTTAVLPTTHGPGALIYVQNAAGAVFGGDRLAIDMCLEAGAAVCVSTPSATRLQGGALSVQKTEVSVGRGAFFESVPDMIIPHALAHHRQQTSIDLADDASAIIVDTLAPGRVARGESHAYHGVSLRLQARFGGVPVLHDACSFYPSDADPALEGSLGKEGYVGSLFALCRDGRQDALAERIDAALAALPGVYGGALPLASGHGAVARFLAGDAPLLRKATYVAWNAARRHLRGLPAPTLRK